MGEITIDMLNIFINQPMTGKTDEEIRTKREKVTSMIKSFYGDCNIIDSYIEETNDKPYLYYLGEAIKKMAKADIVVFVNGWEGSTGCVTEFDLCRRLGITCDFEDILRVNIACGKMNEVINEQ